MSDTVILQPIRLKLSFGQTTPIRLKTSNAEVKAVRLRLVNPVASGVDKHFEQPFLPANQVTLQHNLGKKPAVTIIDTANDEVEAEVNHTSNNELVVTFSSMTSGVILCN